MQPEKNKSGTSRITPADLARKGTEHGEQAALICWTTLPTIRAAFPDAAKVYANHNNAGMGDAVRGARAKMLGVTGGVADLFLPVARHGQHGLYIELKRGALRPKRKSSRGGVSAAQIQHRDQVQADGYGWFVAYGWREAADCLEMYLS